ncbi:MAG: winged helix-turn-helix transcriptional regulator [Gammaproteobacteria bacterium]
MNIVIYTVQPMNEPNREDSVTLEILQAIDEKNNVTQRHLSERLGVALGLTNSYLKRCATKGFIKIQQAPANRYFYYLTPKGFAEKSRLTAEYFSSSFDFYRKASQSISQTLQQCRNQHCQRILLCGVSELAEISRLKAMEAKLDIVGVVDPYAENNIFVQLPVWKNFEQTEGFDACVLTALKHTEELHELAKDNLEESRLFVPDILGLKITKSN